ATKHKYIFDQIEDLYGIPPGVLLAFWAFETDFGAFQGNYNTRNALVTLAHDCRRPELFRPQIFAALELFLRDEFNPETTQGAWAGEIGMVQMLPQDILDNGVDGDGDGLVDLTSSPADALMSGAKMLSNMGWRAAQPWLQEVILPFDMDWGLTGLDTQKPVSNWAALGIQGANQPLYPADLESSIILPQGRFGPAFIAYPNFHVYFEWNQSFVYVTTAAYFATLLEGSPRYGFELEDPGLSGTEMKSLQSALRDLGYDVGKLDGILGAQTRRAVQEVQRGLGLPADAWPTWALLNAL
ncbi:MAG: lytic murein transglycosylase, partial [Paracoccaceae bacterium]